MQDNSRCTIVVAENCKLCIRGNMVNRALRKISAEGKLQLFVSQNRLRLVNHRVSGIDNLVDRCFSETGSDYDLCACSMVIE